MPSGWGLHPQDPRPQSLNIQWQCPFVTRFSCISLFSTGAKSGSFVQKKQKTFGSPLLAKSCLHIWKHSLMQIDFSSDYGRRRNELRNAADADLVLRLRIIVAVQDLKISFYKQILLWPPLLASAPSLRLLYRWHWLVSAVLYSVDTFDVRA